VSEWPYSPEYIKDLCQKVTEARTREGEWESEEEGGRERMADVPQEQGPRLQNRREGCLL
jgi:hypothetical protein